MTSLFYKLGKMAGPKIRTARWAFMAATAPENEVIEAEYAAGYDLSKQIKKQTTPCPELTKTLVQIAANLKKCIKNKSRRFNCEVINASEPQAFCLPGGFIFISSGMIESCKSNPNQLAFIMAHEMGHIIQGHVMERMLADVFIKAAVKGGRLTALGTASHIGIQALEKAYSQENEFRADTFAVRLASAAGYDPAGGIDLFLNLEPLEAKHLLGQYFSTHPPMRDRIDGIKKAIAEAANGFLKQ